MKYKRVKKKSVQKNKKKQIHLHSNCYVTQFNNVRTVTVAKLDTSSRQKGTKIMCRIDTDRDGNGMPLNIL